MSTSPNPNGYIAIVFTYNGTNYASYSDFLNSFYVTLPGGAGVNIGTDQYYAYGPTCTTTIACGNSYPLSNTLSDITDLLPTNSAASSYPNLVLAFQNWAATQAASLNATQYANLYLNNYTGGRVYLSSGDLGLGVEGEPTPCSPTDPAYGLLYDIFEPYIGAQVGHSQIAGNLADITDIDWFSFPITLKSWYYDFSDAKAVTLTNTSVQQENGGDASSISSSLQIQGAGPTNLYPNKALPTNAGSSAPTRLAGPTMAAAAQSYYTDPALDPFPYHYFDDYLLYLLQQQGTAASLFSLTGSFAGINQTPQTANLQAQQFQFMVDFSQISSQDYQYPSGTVSQITPQSCIVLTGYSFVAGSPDSYVMGSPTQPFTITLPWAKGVQEYNLNFSTQTIAAKDAISLGWLAIPVSAATPTAASGTYSAIAVTAADTDNTTLKPVAGTSLVQLIYSVNSNPLNGAAALDDLYQGGKTDWLSLNDSTGLSCNAEASYTQLGSGDNNAVLIINTDANGDISTIQINDLGTGPVLPESANWAIPASSTGLGNNQAFTVTLLRSPPLRNVFVLNGATYATQPVSLVIPQPGSATTSFTLSILAAGLTASGWLPDPAWTTLDQPAGIYGANTGYILSGITGANSSFNSEVQSLENDFFGWVLADLLAALNTGLVGSPAPYNGSTVGQSSAQWFVSGNNPYTAGVWGAKAWEGVTNSADQPINNFWNTWAYNLSCVAGGTNAYGFAFSDRFENGILLGFDPPAANPSQSYSVLLEVIISDPPSLQQS